MQQESSVRIGSDIGNNCGHPRLATTRDQTRVRVALSTGAGRVSVKDTGIGMRVPAVRASIRRERIIRDRFLADLKMFRITRHQTKS